MSNTMEELQEFWEYRDIRLSAFIRQSKVPWRSVVLRPTVQASHEGDMDCIPLHDVGEGRVATDRWVGTFSLAGKHYTIIPRIGQDRFQALLMEAEGIWTAYILDTQSGITGGQLDGRNILALLWTSALEHGRRMHGITKGYVFRQEPDARMLKGQLDLYRQLTVNELGRRHRIACIYDDLTFDNPVNRAILYTINNLKSGGIFPFKGTNNPRREKLIDWHERIASLGVEAGERIVPCNRVPWTRANDGFRRCHELAERLSRHRGAEMALEGIDEALLFDSAEVWEAFLWERLQRVVASMKEDSLRIHSPRLQNGHFRSLMTYEGITRGGLLPDFTLQRKTPFEGRWQTIAILDAKYRKLKWLPGHEEVIQMALYACNSSPEDSAVPCALLYPRAEASGNSSGINTAVESKTGSPAGKAKLSISGQPTLSWWMIDLNKPDIQQKWIEEVDAQLKIVIDHLLAS
jgi:hypothetical protein